MEHENNDQRVYGYAASDELMSLATREMSWLAFQGVPILECNEVNRELHYRLYLDGCLDTKELCALFICSEGTLRRLRRSNILASKKVGGAFVYSAHAIDEVLERIYNRNQLSMPPFLRKPWNASGKGSQWTS